MDIVCSTDDNYIKYCCVMLTSLLENNKAENITVHVLGDNLEKKHKEVLRDIVETRYRQRIFFYIIDNKLVKGFPNSAHSYLSLVAYYRLFITSVLPATVHKVLYLDCNLIVTHSIKDLWNVDIVGRPLAAVKDAHKGMKEHCALLEVDCVRYGYFNTGVVLFNLDYLREYGLEHRAIRFIDEKRQYITFHDQDVLNGLFHKQALFLPYRYNLHDRLYRRKRYVDAETLPVVREELKHPVIIHFSSGKKPWKSRCLHPCRYLYFHYLDMTVWQGERPDMPLKDRLWRWNRLLASFLHLANGYRKQN